MSQNRSKIDKSQLMIDTEKEYLPLVEALRLFPVVKQSKATSSSFMDKMKRLYCQMTTQTEGWIEGFIE